MEKSNSTGTESQLKNQMKRRSKKFANYSISDLFKIKAYVLNANINFTTFCEQLDVDVKVLADINDIDLSLIHNKQKPFVLKKNSRILVPFGCRKQY